MEELEAGSGRIVDWEPEWGKGKLLFIKPSIFILGGDGRFRKGHLEITVEIEDWTLTFI